MALKTLGTAANNTLAGFVVGTNDLISADVATILNTILNDQINPAGPGAAPIYASAYMQQGGLYVPNRGFLKALPGDFIGIDPATGWPVLLSSKAAAGASWVHN